MTDAPKKHRPLLRQDIVKKLAADIRAGVLEPGEALEPVDQAVKRWGVSRTTVVKAYQELSRAGLTRPHPGVGTFVADELPEPLTAPAAPVTLGQVLAVVQALRSDVATLLRRNAA